jgi:hypothetical protein
MFAVRFIGTNKWIVTYPGGRYALMDNAGSTWASFQSNLNRIHCSGVIEEICKVEGINSHTTAGILFDRHPEKYLECVRVEFTQVSS